MPRWGWKPFDFGGDSAESPPQVPAELRHILCISFIDLLTQNTCGI